MFTLRISWFCKKRIMNHHVLASLMVLCLSLLLSGCTGQKLTPLKVSENNRFLVNGNEDPFFWLGDTGWLLFIKLTREEAEKYLEDRKMKGFNVIQVMVLHDIKKAVNVYGDTALVNNRIDMPRVTPGSSFDDPAQYDFWDHIDYIISLAASKGIYMALVPVWGSNVRSGQVSREQAEKYAAWIAGRYHNMNNVIWLNGGDVKGSDSTEIWKTIGRTIRQVNKDQLITYHPFGRTQSSVWFHNEPWLDMNMFQSGHRRYDQDTTDLAYGEDNWKYVNSDYSLLPAKPTLDGEPSYEGIPQGLHDTTQPYWTDSDVRRYAYWSVFAGGCGFTYGHNAVMQFYKPSDRNPSYGAKIYWDVAINAPGSSQMKYLKKLLLSKPYFERVPSQDMLASAKGDRYDFIAITKGNDYLFAYTCNGSEFSLETGKLPWKRFMASWYDPRNGSKRVIGTNEEKDFTTFDPPGDKLLGNDWVLVLEKI
jgi:hypothetical protein